MILDGKKISQVGEGNSKKNAVAQACSQIYSDYNDIL
jgi:hypothetical protein